MLLNFSSFSGADLVVGLGVKDRLDKLVIIHESLPIQFAKDALVAGFPKGVVVGLLEAFPVVS